MSSHFFAMMARMKYIERWALMRNSESENISEHSLEVAMIAHALAVIGKVRFGKDVDEKKTALIAMYHDATEIITGDMPTPVKYFNANIKSAYKEVESIAADKLLLMLPKDMREYYRELFFKDETADPGSSEYESETLMWKYVKAADKLSALIKCIEEEKAGNTEFVNAAVATRKTLDAMEMPELQVFMEEFLESYKLTLDELKLD